MGEPWIKKYTPVSPAEIAGHPSAIALVESFLQNWSRKSKPVWLWGDPGTGKTTTALAFAAERGLELLEVNASDSRNKDAIHGLIGGAVKQGSLFGTSKLILIDEVDGLSGTKDRGGIPELLRVIKGSIYPVIITGYDPYHKKFSALRKACELVEFKPLPYRDVTARLKEILRREKIAFEEEAVTKVAMGAGGDLRAAINDAQSFSGDGSLKVKGLGLLGGRDKSERMQQALLRVLKSTRAEVARGAFDRVDEDVDKVMLWVDHNLPLEYAKPLDLYRGFDALAEADRFLGRIRRWQHYRFYVYAYDLLTAGVAVAKDEKYPGVASYERSDRLLKIWLANQKNRKKQAIAEKIAEKSHCSARDALRDVPFLQHTFSNNAGAAEELAGCYDFDTEEVAWLAR
ncbi:replication factor C large subunit [Candidatus Woesearchaeota archaeon]|nr:replication factor C large subunit [Candidatus Woesearchaeota archaeon]